MLIAQGLSQCLCVRFVKGFDQIWHDAFLCSCNGFLFAYARRPMLAETTSRFKINLSRSYISTLFIIQIIRSEEHTSELQSLMRISYAAFCLKKKLTINVSLSNNAHNIGITSL